MKLFHLHMPKCAGTSLNAWLDTLVHADRARPGGLLRRYGVEWASPAFRGSSDAAVREQLAQAKRDAVERYDVLHAHADHTAYLPDDAFVFTVLRNPVARVLSQYRDFARLVPDDYAHKDTESQAVHADAGRVTFTELAEKHASNTFFRMVFEDVCCRVALQDVVDFKTFNGMSPGERAREAFRMLRDNVDAVGYVETLNTDLDAIVRSFGWPFPADVPTKNVTKGHPSEADEDAARRLSEGDRKLYELAQTLRPTARPPAFTPADWLPGNAPAAGERRTFTMNDPIVGAGFHGRDAANTEACCAWSGPGKTTTLRVPVRPGRPNRISILVKGWMADRVRAGAQWYVDGEPTTPGQRDVADADEAVELDLRPEANSADVSVSVPVTLRDSDVGSVTGDSRVKGLNFWKYEVESQ